MGKLFLHQEVLLVAHLETRNRESFVIIPIDFIDLVWYYRFAFLFGWLGRKSHPNPSFC